MNALIEMTTFRPTKGVYLRRPEGDRTKMQAARGGGNDGNHQKRRFHTFPPHDDDGPYTEISIGRTTLSVLLSSNIAPFVVQLLANLDEDAYP